MKRFLLAVGVASMRRREFLATGFASAGLLAAWPVLAQGRGALQRAAVVIGVNKSGNLPILSAAASGARTVANWLRIEGFEVKLLVDDDDGLVTVNKIFRTIDLLVDRGTLDQLVIYFSGHGFLKGYTEIWMLSGAPRNPNEAVSLRESIALARETAIPSIVFIADTCRSIPQSFSAERVRGSLIFPIRGVSRRIRPEVDRFLAALPGDAALELPVDDAVKRFEGIYTASFLDAYKHPDDTMVRTLSGLEVVPNRGLKNYLLREVPKRVRAHAKSIKLHQLPDTIIESGETTYIGRVVRVGRPPPVGKPLPAPATVLNVVDAELKRTDVGPLSSSREVPDKAEVQQVNKATGFDVARKTILDARGATHFETQTGFSVIGIRVTGAWANLGMGADILNVGDGHLDPAIIRVEPANKRAASMILRFADNSGTVIAALRGYVGTVIVDDGRVVNVSYIPSDNSSRWFYYQRVRDRLLELRALVATAARFGAFRIEGDRDGRAQRGRRLANSIRILKAIDPTLGLYAAYAYAEADIIEEVRSILGYMQADLRADPFDVSMLAGMLSDNFLRDLRVYERTVPFCPMLSQGWGLLRVKGVRLRPAVEKARDHLRPALWTTFGPAGMNILIKAFEDGKLG